jgi:hypothetical protein
MIVSCIVGRYHTKDCLTLAFGGLKVDDGQTNSVLFD